MSDPGLFPPSPLPGSNSVGNFAIGVSPIGTIPPFVWQKTVISQYANSPRLLQLIADFNSYIDQTENIDNFFDMMWNIDTAQGYGLDVWGRIVGVVRTLQVAQTEYFGFNEAIGGSLIMPFGQAPFYSGQTITSNYNLSDTAYRTPILAKAMANICDGSIPAINQLLLNLFPGRGNAFVTEGITIEDQFFGFAEAGNEISNGFNNAPFYSGEPFVPMSMTYTFNFALSPVELAIVTQSGVLPTPTGVMATIVVNP